MQNRLYMANLALSKTQEQKNPHSLPNKVIYVAMKGGRGGREAPTADLYKSHHDPQLQLHSSNPFFHSLLSSAVFTAFTRSP